MASLFLGKVSGASNRRGSIGGDWHGLLCVGRKLSSWKCRSSQCIIYGDGGRIVAWKSDTISDPSVFESAVFTVGIYGNRRDPVCIGSPSYHWAWRRNLAVSSLLLEHSVLSGDSKKISRFGNRLRTGNLWIDKYQCLCHNFSMVSI